MTSSPPPIILFYSRHCKYCGMLMDTVARYDPEGLVLKSVCVDDVRVPARIHSVPALMVLPSKELVFGRAAMDYLLLPGRGKLVSSAAPSAPMTPPTGPQPSGSGADPMAFDAVVGSYASLDGGSAAPSSLSSIDWEEPVQQAGSAPAPQPGSAARVGGLMGIETRTAKGNLPDLDTLRRDRDRDI